MMTEDPWKDIEPPHTSDAIRARRVDPDARWNFFWARGIDRKCLLVLQHGIDTVPRGSLPRLKGIKIRSSEGSDKDRPMLVFALQDLAFRDIFHRLCRDIVASTENAILEKEAIKVALARTWRWHYLLRGGGDQRLSNEQQKGLIGELLVLQRYLLPRLSAVDAISSWHGPLDSPKDFEIGMVCIEVKARRGAASPYVVISSEHQLDDSGIDALFLHVIELSRTPSGSKAGFSLSDVAERVRGSIALSDSNALDAFESLLAATGFRWEDDYTDSLWIEGSSLFYRVSDDFPRITTQTIPPGISNLKYSISLPECQTFLVTDDVLEAALRRQGGGGFS